jgi:hypothetical protein
MASGNFKFSEQDIEALKRALARGTQTVSYGDRSVTYRSIDEMIRLLNLVADRTPKKKKFYANFSSGRRPH